MNFTKLNRIMKTKARGSNSKKLEIGGITMSTFPIHPVEYLKLHLHYEETGTRVLSSLGSVARKIFNSSEQGATIAVVLLTVGLVVFACMRITETASVAASFNFAVTEMALPPLQVPATGI